MIKRFLFLVIILSSAILLRVIFPTQLQSANLSSVKDTLSTSQLSYYGTLGTGNSATNTLVKISSTSNNPSDTTANLFADDVIGIGRSGSTAIDLYTVKDIGNTAEFQITSGLNSANIIAGEAIIATRSAIHTVHFTPVSNFTAGVFQFLIKASTTSGETYNDGIPDQHGFDSGMDVGSTTTGSGTRLKTADVSCPLGATAGVGTTTVIDSTSYHVISCTLGTGVTSVVGVGYTMVVGRSLSTGSQLINPSPTSNHIKGQASGSTDVYSFYIRHLDSSGTVRDSTQGKVAVVESVRVTATVDPTLTFTIDNTNVTSGDSRCGNTLGTNADNTTTTSIAFDSINLSSFNDLAHRLSCVTNAANGYAVTAFESNSLKNTNTGVTIPDTDCDSEDCTTSSATEWSTENDESGFGYSIENVNANSTAFNYDDGSTFVARPFGQGTDNSTTLFSNTSTPTSTERIYICYRLAISTTQEAGDYENALTYTATATF
ncbi:hypothetical protein DRH14_00235 [Candidatus Shapirobacteria bacterium]|nr:MAG: hypothetical protein DRH14_00235 [Candidatus Shapirobacteria bacterium]